MAISRIFLQFFKSEKAGGFILLGCTIGSLLLANSRWSDSYINFWNLPIAGHTLVHWINDGLMSIFFLLIGLELKRELTDGELSSFKTAVLPGVAAIGGMVVPAAIYFFLNREGAANRGTGIPMATDIAFAIGILSLLGNRVPLALKVFLTALAVIDDLGAILVIAFAYSSGIHLVNLIVALGIFGALLLLNKLKCNWTIVYIIAGIAMWWFMLNSGVHATIAGVLLACTMPSATGKSTSVSSIVQHALHFPVAFFILPVFALANTAILIPGDWSQSLGTSMSVGIITALVLGKPLGIFLFSWISIKCGLGALSPGVGWKQIVGAGMLAGIGFTMSIFITLLAFEDVKLIVSAKMAILLASAIAAIAGLTFLFFATRSSPRNKTS